jgi:small subunit ribosomal protein S20
LATHVSAKKRARQNIVRRSRNDQSTKQLRTAIKKFKAAAAAGASAELQGLFVSAQSLLARAASNGLVHKNNANRRIGRLSALLKKAANAPAVAAAPVKKAAKKTTAAPKKAKAAAKPAAKKKPTKK